MSTMIKTEEVDKLIIGRVKPSIYAFTTNMVPNYLKVGDTYRPVAVRLAEWKKIYPDLKKEFEDTATLTDDVFFRDYSIHHYLEYYLHKHRLLPTEIPSNVYYSREFFANTEIGDVSAAIEDIRIDFESNSGKYALYDSNTKLPERQIYASTGEWDPRPNQRQTVENFKKAIANGRKNLLMYAVMRFGKSFTSLCCAQAMGARFVLVVSAKADVREEWKKNVESADNFNKEYTFLTSEDLRYNENIIKSYLDSNKKVVVFLTLQDLRGEKIKNKHKEVFENNIDLLIVDETHYGARAESYGKVLQNTKYARDVKDRYATEDFVEIEEATGILKRLTVNITLHLSGTPYRILMGSEFEKEDIIAFYQFTDIVNEQIKWDEENLLLDDVKEWENPYYGFPQMIRFAFTPSKSALKILESLKNSGVSYAFSELLKTKSLNKDPIDEKHKKFIYENEILQLFRAIDGSETDEGIFSFLDYDKIKKGKMCQHIVIVLPYCASCDALEELISQNSTLFKNLQEYEIINISGVDKPNQYKSIQVIKKRIKDCDDIGKKTITLTVNRMLTGSTVEQWDTMIYLKDTSSPQEYDQAIFRLQNQFIKKYTDSLGNIIKYNMKPQTLLVDFDPNRMFRMQEQKSMIYNVNVDISGNRNLKNRIYEELKISPIIQMNKNTMVRVEPKDILEVVSQYSSSRGVMEETKDIPIDLSVLRFDAVKGAIDRQPELGAKDGLSTSAYSGDGSDLDDYSDDILKNVVEKNNNINDREHSNVNQDKKKLENKFRTYYSRILFFAFLTKYVVESVDDIVNVLDDADNQRIASNIGISKNILIILRDNINLYVLRQIDYKIQNINKLSNDNNVDSIQKALIAIKKFERISDSEITTPSNIANEMISYIPVSCFKDLANGRIIDIASKMGEFAIAIVNKCLELGIPVSEIRDSILSIPTSPIAYEFTRKVYDVLGLDVEMIVSSFSSYDLLKLRRIDKDGNYTDHIDYEKIKYVLSQNCMASKMSLNDIVEKDGDHMKFNAVVGNPPYQGESANTRKTPIYNQFYDLAFNLSKLVVLITPGRFLFDAGQTPQQWNRKMLSDIHFKVEKYFPSSKDVFDSVDIKGGIAITMRDEKENFGSIDVFTQYSELNTLHKIIKNFYGENFSSFSEIVSSQGVYRFSDIALEKYPNILAVSGKGTKSKIVSKVIEKLPEVFMEKPSDNKDVAILGKGRNSRIIRYINRELLQDNEYIDKYNVLVPEANGTGAFDAFSSPIVAPPSFGSADTFLSIGMFETEYEANAALKYIKTKFLRAIVGIKKATHHNPKAVWEYVPLQDFTRNSDIEWSKDVASIDRQLYEKYKLPKDLVSFIESNVEKMI